MIKLFLLLILAATGLAAEKPDQALLDLGFGGVIQWAADYPGSNEMKLKYLPIPYFVYRGRYIKRDEDDGTRVELLKRLGLKLEIGFFGSFPVESEENDARKGMRDLNWLLGAGPRLTWTHRREESDHEWKFFLPVRMNATTDLLGYHQWKGWVFAPMLNYNCHNFLFNDWQAFMMLSTNIVSRDFAGFYYDVDPEFATAERPAYHAHPGYLGLFTFAGLQIPIGSNFKAFLVYTHDRYNGSPNVNSPLMKSTRTDSFLFILTWTLFRTRARAGDFY